ncbi:polar amino acid transport system substrate-binding protein [Desulfohalotomaculum tongense]|uniref:amino acid ABC transporter substrate-binding protein n=1 Tax=Desulforadius tongensis TaxID=1216062 RepID=UPI00195D191F|nr:amino acid ABC transporter substrate-binding protein [Desulforadius tongensis]MBM7855554.1 polar amino acid transport system substrate-binding protein [Desulforadius tongensis]
MRGIKYLWLVVLALGLALLAAGCGEKQADKPNQQAAKTTWEQIQEKGVLVAGLDDTFAPMGFRDENTNELIGFDIDMGAELAKRLGVEIKWQPTEWKGVMGSLNSKKFDVIISGMSVTDERKKVIDFSRNYVNAGIGVVVKKDNNDIASAQDLKGKKIATQTGSSGAIACKDQGLENVTLYDQYPQAFNDLAIGRVDAVVVDVTTAAHYISKKPDTYKLLDFRLTDEPYAIGIRKEDKDLKEAIDKALTEMMQDGTLSAISQKWFGDDVTPKAE